MKFMDKIKNLFRRKKKENVCCFCKKETNERLKTLVRRDFFFNSDIRFHESCYRHILDWIEFTGYLDSRYPLLEKRQAFKKLFTPRRFQQHE